MNYDAEYLLRDMFAREAPVSIAGSTLTLPVERKFADLPSIQRYVSRVLPVRTPTVRARKGTAKAHYWAVRNEIAIPETGTRWAMREIVVLHECAHVLAPAGSKHGPAFQEVFTDLLSQQIGPEAGWLYRVLRSQ